MTHKEQWNTHLYNDTQGTMKHTPIPWHTRNNETRTYTTTHKEQWNTHLYHDTQGTMKHTPIPRHTRKQWNTTSKALMFHCPLCLIIQVSTFPYICTVYGNKNAATSDEGISLTAACSNRSLILCSEPPETPDTIMFTRGFRSGTSRCCNRQVNHSQLSLRDKTQVCSCTKLHLYQKSGCISSYS